MFCKITQFTNNELLKLKHTDMCFLTHLLITQVQRSSSLKVGLGTCRRKHDLTLPFYELDEGAKSKSCDNLMRAISLQSSSFSSYMVAIHPMLFCKVNAVDTTRQEFCKLKISSIQYGFYTSQFN